MRGSRREGVGAGLVPARSGRASGLVPARRIAARIWAAGGGKPLPCVLVGLLVACGGAEPRVAVPGSDGGLKTSALARAERRAFDGAPPTMAHPELGIDCASCHDHEGMDVPDLGFAPPSPHEETLGMSAISRCRQCHVPVTSDELFAANTFEGLRQDLRHGRRLNELAPPTIPHKTFMRENCLACHSGPAAREEIRTDHPERVRCRQCHLAVTTQALFTSAAG